jgi:glycosyltransferase involved in cell wall biosynthesis
MTKVSSITLTYNEANNIRECLNSISWCDEHIVIDEYSDDNTKSIAESIGADVYQTQTPDDATSFDILRKAAIRKATNNYILRIDADERSHQALNKRLQDLVDSSGVDVVEVPRMTFIRDRWIKTGYRWWPDRSPVLFDKNKMSVTDNVHGFMSPCNDADIIQLPAESDSALYHYSYESLVDLIRRRWRYAQMEADQYDLPLDMTLYYAISDLIEGIIIDMGFKKGFTGIAVPLIDSLYMILVKILAYRANKS